MFLWLKDLPISLEGEFENRKWKAIHAGVNPFEKETTH